jgi:L-threonylcarbamoyladenylate synthase
LRHGLIDEEAVAKVSTALLKPQETNLKVPGRLETHYQPQKTLYYFQDYESLNLFCQKHPQEVYVIASKPPKGIQKSLFYPFATEPEQAAFDLYYQLRKADASKAQVIAIELPKAVGLWQGVRERIVKAGIKI